MIRLAPGLITLLILPAVSAASTSPAEPAPWTANLYFENDLFAETDQNYTNGIRVSWVSPNIDSYLDDPQLPGWLNRLNDWLLLADPDDPVDANVQRNLVLTLGQQIYTPEDIERYDVDPNDRPYAGWLYGGIAYHARTGNRLNTLALNLGIVGPAAMGEQAQDWIHSLRGFDKFNGWDNQLENEPGIQLLYEHKRRLWNARLGGVLGSDLIGHAGVSLGNIATFVNGGAEWRLGWRLPQDFGTSALRTGGDNSAPGLQDDRYRASRRDNNLGLHAFVSMDGRWVLRDIFLDGNTFEDSHSVNKHSLVGEAATGVALLYRGWKLSFARVHRSREFHGQAKRHAFGSLSLSYSY
ncbi:lipid A deacylase LpxR family protein [Marinobacterium arenosum]|uniref:lipid A deacylase LpxR family protein n=1 Tax=Marinobacterium arenosum TaxID=2862496 RepID=UPI001C96EF74|nr:lipid A deacylase LpxR family protein [Marinobacterium arenosum]MBY4676341.1 lipid A deacylase LpxR family protein [Marinobacterium arenosum]